jgi:GNAT superfamily N-acetyltransferase
MAVNIRKGKSDDIPAIARLLVDTWRSTFRGLLYATFLDKLDYHQQEERHRNMMKNSNCNYYVAVDEHGQLIAFANAGPDRTEHDPLHAELYAIYVSALHQGEGNGRKLVAAVAKHLALQGHSSLRVWVLAVNPFVPFYERLGGRKERVERIELGGQSLE